MKLRISIGFFFAVLIVSTPLRASTEIIIKDGQDDYYIASKVKVLEDKSRTLTFKEVKDSGKFKAAEKLNFGLTSSAYWMKFTVTVPKEYDKELFLNIANPNIDILDVYIPENDEFVSKRYGDRLPFNKRDINFNLFLVRLHSKPGSYTYYIRAENEDWLILPLFITSGEFVHKLFKTTNMIDGIFYGALIMMFLYYLLISIATRTKTYLYFSIFILSSFLAEFTAAGHGPEYLSPGTVWPNNVYIILEFILITAFTHFFRSYLFSDKLKSTLIERIIAFLTVLYSFGIIFSFILPIPLMEKAFSISIILLFIILVAGLAQAMLKKMRQAFYFAAAISILISGTFVFYSLWGGLLPINNFTLMAYPISFILMLALFSLGLADKVNRIFNENIRLLTIEKEKAIIDKEIEMAQAIQDNLLPKNLPRIPHVTVAFKYVPMSGVGGDFVDIIYEKDSDLVGLFICDVVGHGVYAALLASMTKMALTVWKERLDSPQTALEEIREKLLENLGENFITACICSFNHATGKLKVSNAGHPPVAIMRVDGNVELMNPKGRAITNFFNPNYSEEFTQLKHGDTVILYTDGLTEAYDGKKGMIGDNDERFCEWLSRYSGKGLTPDEICSQIYDDAIEHTGRLELDDDFTVIVMRYNE